MSDHAFRYEEYIQELIGEAIDKYLQGSITDWFDSFVDVKTLTSEIEEYSNFSCIDKPAQRLRQRELDAGDTTVLDGFLKEFQSKEDDPCLQESK